MATITVQTPNASVPDPSPTAPASGPQPPPPAPSVDEMLLALSHIVLRRESRPLNPSRYTDEPLDLLNLLSLLLVTEATGDVAAVMFRVLSKDTLELHYAKNRPCTIEEKAYIHALFITICDTTNDVAAACWNLLSLVIAACKAKMKSRATKICERLAQLSVAGAVTDTNCTLAAETSLRTAIGASVFPLSITMPNFLRGWFTHLLQQPSVLLTAWHPRSVYQMLHLSYSIGRTPDIALLLLDAKLLQRIRKLGDYFGAALALFSNAATLPAPQLRNLRIIEVVPVIPRSLAVSADFVNTVNAWAHHTGELPVSEEELRTAFPDMDERPTDPLAKQNVTVAVHCECTLFLAVLTTAPALVEIGVSKSSCFMCCEFIRAVQRRYRYMTVRVSSWHGKHVAGWRLPVAAPRGLGEVMVKKVRDEMNVVLLRAMRNRKLDEVPMGEWAFFGMGMSVGEEEFMY